MKVGIIGLGLIGGSLSLSLRKSKWASALYGYDISEENGHMALEMGLVDRVFDKTKDLVDQSDILIIAIPVDKMLKVIPDVLDLVDDQLVIELGSTKRALSEAVEEHPKRSQLVLAHPMAGTEFSGPKAAIHELFSSKSLVVCDPEKSIAKGIELTESMFKAIGMYTVFQDSVSHDIHAAYVSHISHISAFALALTVLEKEKDEDRLFEMASGGFRSTVRLANSSADMWTPIFDQNKDNVLDVLDEHINVLARFRSLIIKRDFEGFYDLIVKANDIKRILK